MIGCASLSQLFHPPVSRVTVIFENHKQTSSYVYKRAYKVKIHCALHLICLFVVDCIAMLSRYYASLLKHEVLNFIWL